MENRHGVFLSLKDDFYRTHMHGYFRRLRQRNGEEEKAAVKEEAFKFFINSGHTLMKLHNWRRPELGHCAVDEKYCRTSECLRVSETLIMHSIKSHLTLDLFLDRNIQGY